MADSNHSRNSDFFDDDPFAELTRIMGHDPRGEREEAASPSAEHAAPAADPAEGDLDLDLDRELAADLDFSIFEEPQATEPETVSDWRVEEPAAGQPQEAVVHEAAWNDAQPAHEAASDQDDFGAALERELFAGEESTFSAPEPQASAHDPESAEEQPAEFHVAAEPSFDHDDLDAALEQELFAGEEPTFSALEPEASVYDPEPAEAQSGEFQAAAEPSFDHDDLDAALEQELSVEEEPSFSASEPVEEPQAGFHAVAEPSFNDDDFDAQLDHELSVEEEPSFSEPEPAEEPQAEFQAAAEPSFDHDDLGAALEQELSAASREEVSFEPAASDDASDLDPGPLEDEPSSAPRHDWENAFAALSEPEASESEQAWHADADAPEQPVSYEPGEAVSWEPVKQPVFPAAASAPSLEDELSALLTADAPASAQPEPAWQSAAAGTFGRANFPPASGHGEPAPAETGEEEIAREQPAGSLTDDDFAEIFGDGFSFDLADEASKPEPQQAAAPAAAVAAGAFAGLAAAPARAAPQADMPDVETIEVAEAARPVADDLDIPDVDYGAPEPRSGYDDLDDEFAAAFDELALPGEPAPAPTDAAASAPAGVAGEFAPDDYTLDEGEWQAAAGYSDDSYDFGSEFEEEIGTASFEDEPQPEEPARNRRGLMVAALVAGVAVIGGAGVFGMSFFGGSDGPALVRADTDPMKVRPENPGGATVPNQDSPVYQRVGGAEQDADSGQERLVTTAEEPVDVVARTEPPALAPGIEEEAADGDVAAADPEPKVEDRLDAAQETAAVDAPGEVGAVAPRRVRTMVVRPDGTLVPREEVEQPAAAQPSAAQLPVPGAPVPGTGEDALASAGTLGAPALAPANPLPQGDPAAAQEEEGGPVVETPATVGVVPTQRREPSATSAAQPAVQQPAAQAPAATQASAPAAAAPAASGATSEWSMQIASQPTAEGAQSTYQDLARRYGGVLEGRGVNIVRADIEGMGTYYRVRIPASNRDEAIQLCTRYKAAGGSCFVSR